MKNSAEKLGERGVLVDSMHLAGPTVNMQYIHSMNGDVIIPFLEIALKYKRVN